MFYRVPVSLSNLTRYEILGLRTFFKDDSITICGLMRGNCDYTSSQTNNLQHPLFIRRMVCDQQSSSKCTVMTRRRSQTYFIRLYPPINC